ncbi:MAG: dephospho-CoA kinase [Gemmatimonadaceae bacterium]|nr:dephospho-CoA kinase [Gemmatimonadaceae bacterium]
MTRPGPPAHPPGRVPDGTRVVALTGNIAAGKSVVARRLAALGATIIDADVLAREAVAPGTPALAAIVARFGADMLAPDGTLDRARLRRHVFADPVARTALNAIVHPEVIRRRDAALAAARARGDRVVVFDIPLLFETGRDGEFQTVLLVDAPAAVRRDRLVRDRGLSPAEAEAMIAAQGPSGPKRARATLVFDNVGTVTDLEAAVDAAWPALRDGH